MQLQFTDDIPCVSNVHITARNPSGEIVAERTGHNVFTLQGRNWIRNLVAAYGYIGLPNGNAHHNIIAPGTFRNAVINYRPRYVGFGVGGTLQNWSSVGPNAQTESVYVDHLERPIAISNSAWLQELLPQGTPLPADISDPLYDADGMFYPTDRISRYRCILQQTDLSHTPTPGYEDRNPYSLQVPMSEIGLFTGETGNNTKPGGPDPGTGPALGMIAYHTFTTIPKTRSLTFEVVWDLRF